MGEDTDGVLETTSKLRQLLLDLTDQKVDIQLDDDTYKSTYQIMLDISKVMDTMTDMEQATALEAMFGKRQANIGASILQNMAEAEDVLTASLESSGSALEEQMKYQEGISYSLDRLTASMQEMAHVTLDSSTVKFFVDLMNSIVETTSAVGGLIPVLATLSILYLSFNKKEKHSGLQNFIGQLFKTKTIAGTTSVAIGGLTMSTQALTASLTFGLSVALPFIISGIQKLSKSSEEAIQASKELREEFESTEETFKSNKDTLASLDEEFKTLSRGVDNYGRNVSLSTKEYERYKNIISEIVGISRSVVDGYDNEGNAIVKKNSLIERSIELLEEERRQRILTQASDDSNWTVAKGNIETYNQYLRQAKQDQDEIVNTILTAITDESGFDDSGRYVDELSEDMYQMFLDAFDLTDKKIDKTSVTDRKSVV